MTTKQPEALPAPATQQAGERVYAFRRKGLEDFCTCDEARYEELSNKPHLFETRVFYPAPQPPTAQAAESVPAPPPPPECETEAEKRAFAFGWFKALESERMKAESVHEDAAQRKSHAD